MAYNERESLLIELAKTGEALKFMQEQLKELKDHVRDLYALHTKQSEEIKDCFFVTEDNRKQIEELSDSLKQDIAYTTENVDRFKKVIDSFDERKDKKTLNLFQVLVTAAALIAGFVIQFVRK
jgi:predicted  nucleic acid-binding Zn-ribbon protein